MQQGSLLPVLVGCTASAERKEKGHGSGKDMLSKETGDKTILGIIRKKIGSWDSGEPHTQDKQYTGLYCFWVAVYIC